MNIVANDGTRKFMFCITMGSFVLPYHFGLVHSYRLWVQAIKLKSLPPLTFNHISFLFLNAKREKKLCKRVFAYSGMDGGGQHVWGSTINNSKNM